MKRCHHCDATFAEGLTCPSCHAFVPDPPPPDDPRDDAELEQPTAPAGPSWARRAPEEPTTPATTPTAAPRDAASSDAASRDVAANDDGDRLPAAYPAWAKRVDEPPPPPREAPVAAWIDAPPPTATSGPGWGAPTWAPPLGVPPDGPRPKQASFTLTPTNLAFGLGALLVVVVLAAFVLRPTAAPKDQVAADIAGTCFVYNADHSKLDRPVACDQPHDGSVLGFASDQSSCPTGTDAILTTASDTAGRNGVLCVSEKPST